MLKKKRVPGILWSLRFLLQMMSNLLFLQKIHCRVEFVEVPVSARTTSRVSIFTSQADLLRFFSQGTRP
jgi:hypothetical protein